LLYQVALTQNVDSIINNYTIITLTNMHMLSNWTFMHITPLCLCIKQCHSKYISTVHMNGGAYWLG